MMTLAIRVTALLLIATTFAGFAGAEAFAVFRSSDRGQTWIRSDAGMPGRSRINAFGSADEVLFAGTDSGIFTSRDEAHSWQPAAGVAMSAGRIISFASLGRKVFAGTDGKGMLVSPDGGQSWVLDRAFPSPKVRCVLSHKGKVYAGTDEEGVFASPDGGQTWTRLSGGFPPGEQVFALAAVEGRLFAGLYSRGLYGWDDQQHLWLKQGSVTPLALASSDRTLIAGHNPGGLYWSADLGASWSKGVPVVNADGLFTSGLSADSGELLAEPPVWELASNDDLVFAGASAGIYHSKDHGRTWTPARTGLPAESPGIAFLLKQNFVLAGTRIK